MNYKKQNRKISNKIYNINTNSYDNLISYTDFGVVDLYNKFDKYIMKNKKDIIKNYLKKDITYKTNKRVLQVVFKQNEFRVIYPDYISNYDIENKTFIIKGYENVNMNVCLKVNNEEDLKYACMLFDEIFNHQEDKKEKIIDLEKSISKYILNLDKKVKLKEIQKGKQFVSNRNFAFIQKQTDCIKISLLNVNDQEEILGNLKRSIYNPMTKYYKIYNEKDIEIIKPFIEESYNISFYNPKDVKNGDYLMYHNEKELGLV